MPTHFGPVLLERDYIVLQVDPTNWSGDVSHGSYSYLCYWESGIPYQGRLLVRVPANEADHFRGNGGFSPIDE
jgi:hypothetical protein